MDKILAWHFLPDDGRLANRNRRKVEVGKTYSVRWPIAICENGMHGARRLIDALSYAPGAVVERVEIWGDVVEHNDKLCGRHRKCLALVDVTRLLHEFACDVAEDALKMAKVKDKRSWAAIEMKRKWLKGKATNDELAAAGDAAWYAARDAAGDAAWYAARDAAWEAAWEAAGAAAQDAARAARVAVRYAARDAAWDAAWAAARAAAGDAAWAAARAAVRDAAWAAQDAARAARAAAWDAARAAAWDKYNTWLTERVEKVLEENNG